MGLCKPNRVKDTTLIRLETKPSEPLTRLHDTFPNTNHNGGADIDVGPPATAYRAARAIQAHSAQVVYQRA